jgi:hypothetical protein
MQIVGMSSVEPVRPEDEQLDATIDKMTGTFNVDCTFEMTADASAFDGIVAATAARAPLILSTPEYGDFTITNIEQTDDELRIRAARPLARLDVEVMALAYFRGATVWVRESIGNVLVNVWPLFDDSTDDLNEVAADLFAALDDATSPGVDVGVQWLVSHHAPIGPELQHCLVHSDCCDAIRSRDPEAIAMNLACWAEQRSGGSR